MFNIRGIFLAYRRSFLPRVDNLYTVKMERWSKIQRGVLSLPPRSIFLENNLSKILIALFGARWFFRIRFSIAPDNPSHRFSPRIDNSPRRFARFPIQTCRRPLALAFRVFSSITRNSVTRSTSYTLKIRLLIRLQNVSTFLCILSFRCITLKIEETGGEIKVERVGRRGGF